MSPLRTSLRSCALAWLAKEQCQLSFQTEGSRLIPLLNRSTGDGAECDDFCVGVGAVDGVDGAGILRLASDEKRLVYLVLHKTGQTHPG
jgi:hypothetical protein